MKFLCIFIVNILVTSLVCPYDYGGTWGGAPFCVSTKVIDSKICTSVCPTLFTAGKKNTLIGWCYPSSGNSAILFDLQFSSIKDLYANSIASSYDSSILFQNPSSVAYNDASQTSPLPTIDRGFYFATTSSIVSNKSFTPGCYFTLNIWIKPLNSGEILNVIVSSTTYMRMWADASGVYMFSMKIYDSSNNIQDIQTFSFTSSYASSWHTASIVVNQVDCDTTNISFLINGGDAGSPTISSNSEFRFPNLSYVWTVGNISGGNSFRGFIYWLQTRADTTASAASLTVTVNCVENQYWDGSTCQNCNSNCPTWPWCVRGTDCLTCSIVDCIDCQGYPPLTCITCNTGLVSYCCDYLGSACSQTWTNSGCSTGYFLIGGVCLYACPYGFGNCAAVSTAVLTADFTGTFAGSYGTGLITATSSASYNYWNSPETNDPFPAKNRGLYFNSNQYLSGSINLSNTWSIALWVYAISGTILSHSTNKLTVDSSGTITFYLEKWDGSVSPTSYSASNALTTYTWTHISYSVGFANKATTMTPYMNNAAGSATTVTNYVFRLPSGGTLYVGKGSPKFNGFIAYFILWQTTISDFSAYYSISTLTGGTVSALWSCDYASYYDGSTCKSCLGTCTNGCTRGTSCYICDDFLCQQCSSFASGACTLCISNAVGSPCSCDSGFYQPTDQALCTACYSGCAHCTGASYYLCTSCSSGYYLYNSITCLSDCPTGYTKNTGTGNCDLSGAMPLSLSFSNQILLDQISGKQVGSSSSNSYPTYDSNDPIPAYLRGYYFNSNSYLTTMFVLAPNFSISLWLKAESSGMVITKYTSSVIQWFVQILSSGYPKLSLLLMDTTTTIAVTGSSSVLDSWFFVSFDCEINADGTTTISSYIDAVSQAFASSSSALYLLDSNTGNFYIGLNSGGFTGFLWELKIFSQNNHAIDDWKTTGCAGGCTKCPLDFTCPDDCSLTQYYDGSSCSSCINTCTQGCRNSDTCRLCKTKECATCTEFIGANSCLTCISNAISDGSGGCTCAANAFWVPSTQTCDVCDNACSTCLQTTYFECSTCLGSYQKTGTVCLNECPYGTSCSTLTSTIIDQSFDADFQGSYGIFTTGTSAATYQFSNSPETVDPIPAYNRGLYFDGTMYLLSSVTVYFSHSFSIGVWLYVITNGDLLQKQTLLTLTSTGSITATMVDPLLATSSQALSPGSSFSGWCYLSITFEYSLGSTTLTIYLNGVSSSTVTAAKMIYRDQDSTYLMLGKSNNPGFIGFLYYFQLWNTAITGFPTIISSFTFCDLGDGAICLWTCDISSYIDGASTSSCSSCSYGCRRASSCNICEDALCTACDGFDAGKCTICDSSVTLSGGYCLCNPGFGRSADGLSCASCFPGCSLCLAVTYNQCTACGSGFYLFANTGQCLSVCPTGYNTGTSTCDYVTNIAISLDLTDQVRLDTVSGFNVGSSNTNTYPDWVSDSNDPIPSYQRGYYFYQQDYLTSSVMIAPSFTISLWTKPLDAGILLVKYNSAEILKIEVDSSGFPLLSIVFEDSTTAALTTSTNIKNYWHYLSFTAQIQSDGKTILNLYINNAASASSTTSTTSTYFKDINAGSLIVGNDNSHGTSGLYGFFARLIIYNSHSYRTLDYATTSCAAGCSSCPSNNQCLSDCAVNEYPSSCTQCLTGCSQGCVSGLTCGLCRDKECYECSTFSGECISCLTNAHKVNNHCECKATFVWDSSAHDCVACDPLCSTCSTIEYNGCLTCISSHYLVQSVFCMPFCPTGYIINGSNCDSDPNYASFFVFNLMPHQIKDVVTDLKSSIPVITGKDNKFYPNYDSTDPIASIYRGYYFSGSSYMQLPPYTGNSIKLLTVSPKFVISAWIKPISSSGVIFSKQENSGSFSKYISLELINKFPSLTLTLQDSTTTTFTSTAPSLEITLSQWSFISANSDISATPQQIITLTANTANDISNDLGASWLSDLENSFLITIGAFHIDSTTLSSFFNGFLWDLKIYNTLVSVSSLTLTTCTGCSLCPIDNSNACLDSCDLDKYWDGSSCVSCSSGCLTKGCTRVDKTCNLCQDVICEVCDDYTTTCLTCKTHASLIATSCQCNSGYYWDADNEGCLACDVSCKTCTASTPLDCSTCANKYYSIDGICSSSCPLGYSPIGSACVLAQEKIFDLDLNTLNGVIYDSANSIPAVTGSSKQFYPNYEDDDPIPAYLRGFYFNGKSSILRMPEYSNYTSPKLIIPSTFTISLWINSETLNGALLSKHSITDSYSTMYAILLNSNTPSILFTLGSSQVFYACEVPLNNYEWSHISLTLENSKGLTSNFLCYINGISGSSILGSGTFTDTGPHTAISIGAQLSSTSPNNFYKGFIYSIQIFNSIKSISALSTTSCTESCSVCPISQTCIPNCKINEYWSGPAYNKCYQCNIKCKETCRNWRSTCSLCNNLLCENCTDYSASGCVDCKENAINTDSCICDINYVLDTTNNSTCIPVEAGGFRGSDGALYPCPDLCTYCESYTKCNSCVDNASIKNDLCYCNLGYNGTENCTYVSFSAKLTVFADNSLYLLFSDTLASSLTDSDFSITIQKQGTVSFKLEEVNNTCFYLSLVISKEISKGTLATLEFFNLTEVRSISNGILNSSYISASLNSYDPAPYSAAVEAITSKAAAGVQVAISGALALSIVNPSPSSLWSMMNCLQILSYLTLSGIPLSSKMSSFLNNMNSFNLFPNMFTYIVDKNEGNTPYHKAKDFGYDTDLILITTGNDFTLIIASLSALPVVFFFAKCSFRWVGKKFMKTVKAYQFGFYLRFWIQCYLELGAAASIGLITLGFENVTQVTNFMICLVIYILLVITPPGYFWFSYKNKNRIQSREKSFTELFSSFFYEFRIDRGLLATQYYFVFFIRRFIYIINLVFLRDYPQTEVTINVVLSLMTILHLIFYWPFEDPILQINNLLTESMIFLVMGSTSAYLFDLDQEIVSTIENAIVALVVGIMIIQSFSSIAIFARTLYGIIHHKLTKAGIMRNSIQPLTSQHKKIEK